VKFRTYRATRLRHKRHANSRQGEFGEEYTQGLELWIDDNTHIIKAEDAEIFTALLRTSTLFKDLAKILRNCPRIGLLEVALVVEVVANSDLIMADMMMETEDEDDDDDDNDPVTRIENIANAKATEILVDSDILTPLLNLTNVVTCNINFDFDDMFAFDKEKYQPPARYIKKFRDMKLTIEGNFRETT
jgi:hypothetical protein